ncbi:MAG: hypothetical protein ABJC04_10380, partial [Verrucomicrobiota bacterium]
MKLALGITILLVALTAPAERINQEGRILGSLLAVTNSVLFNTAQADAVVSSMQIYPLDNPWNEDISRALLLSNSTAMMSQVTNDLATNRQSLRLFFEMNYVLVPTNQPNVAIAFFNYPSESDPAPYPIPTNMPVELWPNSSPTTNLVTWQMDTDNVGGDRHSIIAMPGSNLVWETWLTKLTNGNWRASNGAKFDSGGNGLRAAGWTSGDAAGLPMFPALIRYDECERGMVEHAMRLVVKRTRAEYIYPARHYASVPFSTDPNVPAMGQRLRLKSTFQIQTNWTTEEKAVLLGLKKYGAFVADNGGFFSISVTPDDRWPGNCFSHMPTLSITNFEVIQTTAQNGGPRSPDSPVVNAGPDATAPMSVPWTSQGFVTTFTNLPVTNTWKFYSGPGNVTFDKPRFPVAKQGDMITATATFDAPGDYLLRVQANDQSGEGGGGFQCCWTNTYVKV